MADLVLNHRLAQGTLGGVVRGFDGFDRQVRPEAIGHGQQLLAGADGFGPRLLSTDIENCTTSDTEK
jgi:hypothetical protein